MLIAAAVLSLVIGLLAIPIELDFRLSTDPSAARRLDLRWLFGLVRADLARSGAAGRVAPRERNPRRQRRRSRPARRANPVAALRQPAFRRRLIRFGRDAWRAIGKRGLYLRLRIGLGDPADTGRLWALIGPLSGYLAGSEQAVIAVEPDFVDSVFEARGSGTLRVVPLRLLALVSGLVLSPPFWHGLRRMRAAR